MHNAHRSPVFCSRACAPALVLHPVLHPGLLTLRHSKSLLLSKTRAISNSSAMLTRCPAPPSVDASVTAGCSAGPSEPAPAAKVLKPFASCSRFRVASACAEEQHGSTNAPGKAHARPRNDQCLASPCILYLLLLLLKLGSLPCQLGLLRIIIRDAR